MKAAWQVKNLGDVCHLIGGGTPSKDNADFYTGNIPWATVRDMRSDVITDTEYKITESAIKNSSTNIIPSGSVIIATRVGLGKVCLLNQDTAINQDLRGIFPKDAEKLSTRFLFWWLKSVAHLIVAEGTGATVQGVKLPFVKSLQIPLPPLPEQQRIVAILDEAFEAIAAARTNTEQNHQNARNLFESYLQSVFRQHGNGWVERSFSEVCEISSTLVDPRQDEYLEQLHIGGANIEAKTGKLLELRTAREENLISGKFIFDESMVLYSKIRPYLMKVVRPDFKGLCSADIYPLSPKSGLLDRNYLFHMLLSPQFTDYANAGSARAGMPKVNRGHLFSYRCFFPPIEQQIEFAASLDAIHEETQCLESLYQRKIAALDELKQSLLQQAFSGQL
ncbi:restriction endonuclease subunit S [Aeromonas jandaei]|uniref:restriction endonuclease subunit S n=1 Tax=Aeromonas jandaei TaxID=650 RepID=UPI0011171168|nr:restriction endonuclease subunit S [Aeromonas jandaei]TNH98846.1 restriction endonuclease subunit S [Aeromonas jandaei]